LTTISPAYAEQNRQLHEDNEAYGISGAQWAIYVETLAREEGYKTVCDWGCGKGLLAEVLRHQGADVSVAEYDPAIPGKDATPEPAELVVCTDVFEHIEPECLNAALLELSRITQKKLLFDVHTQHSLKALPDGRNAHLIIQPPDWWRYKITRYFDIVHWVERVDLNMFYGEAVPIGQKAAHDEAKALRPKRRKMPPEVSSMIQRTLRMSETIHDELSRMRIIRMYEGDGDEAADMQLVYDTLDDVADPAAELLKIARLARKAVMLRVRLTPERTEDYWRPLIEAHWHIIDWIVDPDGVRSDTLGIVGAPKVAVGGAKVVGVVEHEERWVQVEQAMARVSKRIQPSAPHKRRAILGCYGPSLRDHIDRIKAEMGEADCDVVSVSGAHDLLLESGIVPTYHVECDPRAHKADNIDKGYPGVRYLIGSCAHPALFDKLEGCDVALWHVSDGAHVQKLLRLQERGQHIITGGGSVGLRAIAMLYSMGYRDFSIYGMDCSFADEGKQQWAGKHAGKRQDVISVMCAGQGFHTSPVLLTYATDFIEMIQKIEMTCRVYGDGLLARLCQLHASYAAQPTVADTVNRMGYLFPAADTEWPNIIGSCNASAHELLKAEPRRSVAVQAGGNVGVMPSLLAEHFGKVFTFEPDVENFQCLDANVRADNVVKCRGALGALPGKASLTRKPNNCGGHYINGGGAPVAVTTIDDLWLGSCDLIALDVEGYEMEALQGAQRTIAAFKPTIMLEDSGLSERYGVPKGAAPQWLVDTFGYRVVSADRRDVILRCD
jgi:FkbM family methyltransferase